MKSMPDRTALLNLKLKKIKWLLKLSKDLGAALYAGALDAIAPILDEKISTMAEIDMIDKRLKGNFSEQEEEVVRSIKQELAKLQKHEVAILAMARKKKLEIESGLKSIENAFKVKGAYQKANTLKRNLLERVG